MLYPKVVFDTHCDKCMYQEPILLKYAYISLYDVYNVFSNNVYIMYVIYYVYFFPRHLIDSRHLLLGRGCHCGGISEFPIPLVQLHLVLGLHASTHAGGG